MNDTRKLKSLQYHLIELHDHAVAREDYHQAQFLVTGNPRDAALAAKHRQVRESLAERLVGAGGEQAN